MSLDKRTSKKIIYSNNIDTDMVDYNVLANMQIGKSQICFVCGMIEEKLEVMLLNQRKVLRNLYSISKRIWENHRQSHHQDNEELLN